MISISVFYGKTGDSIRGFKVEGHSGYECDGKDIICAAVSATAYNAINGLEEIAGLKNFYKINDDGEMECIISEEPGKDAKITEAVQTILKLTAIGFGQIATEHGKYVVFRNKEM